MRHSIPVGLVAAVILVALSTPACVGGQGRSEVQKIEDGDIDLVLGPEISKSRGEPGGIVLLWPRIIPRTEAERLRGPARALQDRLRTMLQEAFPDRPIDVRPEGERACMKTGCIAASVGVLIAVQDDNCVAVTLVSEPGRSPQMLTPWAGRMTAALSVPFREPPESSVRIDEFVECDLLPEATLGREEVVKAAVRQAFGP